MNFARIVQVVGTATALAFVGVGLMWLLVFTVANAIGQGLGVCVPR